MYSLSVVLLLALVALVKCQNLNLNLDNQPVAAVECFSAISTGDCRARLPSFYYNLSTGTCDCFIFGGCNANGNIFSTLEGCMNTCAVQPRFQTISSTCVGIFGAENPKFSVNPQGTTTRPISFSSTSNLRPVVTGRPAVKTTAFPSTVAPGRPAVKTTPFPLAAAPVTNAPGRPAVKTTAVPSTSNLLTNAPTTAATTRAPVTNAPTAATTRRTSAPSKPAGSTPGPWDHWLNL